MSKINQNVVFLIESSATTRAWEISLQGGNMALNVFCIDEDNEIESSGVFYLKKCEYAGDAEKGNGNFY